MARLKPYAFTVHLRARLGEEIRRRLVPPKLDTDLVQYPVRLTFDAGQGRFIQQIVCRYLAARERCALRGRVMTGKTATARAAAATLRGWHVCDCVQSFQRQQLLL